MIESGYYYCLFHGGKMVPSISNGNCYWEIMYLEVIKENETKYHGSRKLTPGVWVCGIGSVNWIRLQQSYIIDLKKVELPQLPDERPKFDIQKIVTESIKGT